MDPELEKDLKYFTGLGKLAVGVVMLGYVGMLGYMGCTKGYQWARDKYLSDQASSSFAEYERDPNRKTAEECIEANIDYASQILDEEHETIALDYLRNVHECTGEPSVELSTVEELARRLPFDQADELIFEWYKSHGYKTCSEIDHFDREDPRKRDCFDLGDLKELSEKHITAETANSIINLDWASYMILPGVDIAVAKRDGCDLDRIPEIYKEIIKKCGKPESYHAFNVCDGSVGPATEDRFEVDECGRVIRTIKK